MSSKASAVILAGVLLALACVTGRSPDAPAGPAPATGAGGAPGGGELLALRPIPFPPGTFSGKVEATALPRVSRAGDALVVRIPFGTKSDAECVITARELEVGGSIEVLMAQSQVRAGLRDQWVDELEVMPETGIFSLVIRRDDRTQMRVAAYRDRSRTLVCVHDGPGDAPAFKRMVTSLVTSLRSPGATPDAGEIVELCALKVGDGSLGFERVEIVRVNGEAQSRVTTFIAFRDGPNAVSLSEVNYTEAESGGRISTISNLKLFGGRVDLKADLVRDTAGRYRATVTSRRGPRYEGPVRVADAEGLPSSEGVRERLRRDILRGGTQELKAEAFDPFESPDKAVVKVFRRGEREGEVIVTDGAYVMREVLDAEGFVRSSEMNLLSGGALVSSCHREEQRISRAGPIGLSTEDRAPIRGTRPAPPGPDRRPSSEPARRQ
jgi:hypothetical protein